MLLRRATLHRLEQTPSLGPRSSLPPGGDPLPQLAQHAAEAVQLAAAGAPPQGYEAEMHTARWREHAQAERLGDGDGRVLVDREQRAVRARGGACGARLVVGVW